MEWLKLKKKNAFSLIFLFDLRHGQVYTEGGKPPGYDRVRAAEIGNKDFELDVLEEAYTTEHWLVRIYKVKDLRNRGV